MTSLGSRVARTTETLTNWTLLFSNKILNYEERF